MIKSVIEYIKEHKIFGNFLISTFIGGLVAVVFTVIYWIYSDFYGTYGEDITLSTIFIQPQYRSIALIVPFTCAAIGGFFITFIRFFFIVINRLDNYILWGIISSIFVVLFSIGMILLLSFSVAAVFV